jgi:hypothetical protein
MYCLVQTVHLKRQAVSVAGSLQNQRRFTVLNCPSPDLGNNSFTPFRLMCLTWMLESEPCFSFTTTHKNNRETNLPFFSRNLVSHFFWSCYKDSLQTNYRPTLRNSMECPSRRWSWVAQFPSADQVCLNQMHVSFHAENLFGKDPRECAWNVLSRGHIVLLCH